jgi:hypothetical protein
MAPATRTAMIRTTATIRKMVSELMAGSPSGHFRQQWLNGLI